MKTIIEPFKIKTVEPIRMTTRQQREEAIRKAGYNLFKLAAEDCLIDLLTDSGTGAMSSEQWAGIMRGDESYAGAKSFERFESVTKRLTGMRHIFPVHQGRAAERILFSALDAPGKIYPSNTHFDTTRANIEYLKGKAVDLVVAEGKDPTLIAPFKGNMDIDALRRLIVEVGPENIPLGATTVTNNATGGQPVSMENIRATRDVLHEFGIPLFIDCARFAENAWFIKQREPGYTDRTLESIAQEMFSLADGCWMSAKKDALVNIGGFLALNDDDLAAKCQAILVLGEGFPTYGGLAGRDLEAIAQGLTEVLDEEYMRYRIRSVEFIAERLVEAGVPIFEPAGGHAIYLDAKRFLPHILPEQLPGQALSVALYLEGGVRSVEIGSVMFGKWGADGKFVGAPNELVRLAIPRRVYTQSHMEYLVEVIIEVYKKRETIGGIRFDKETPILRHFTSTFLPA